MKSIQITAVLLATSVLVACGGGVPVKLRIDEFSFALSLDEIMEGATSELAKAHLLPPGTQRLPEVWPESLPDIQYQLKFDTDPVPIDLTPPPGSEEADKYSQINDAKQAVRRIEINRLVLRVEQSNISVALPELTLQVADESDANPLDRHAWFSIGRMAPAEPGFIGDIELEWFTGGESFLNAQFGDDLKELAIRTVGEVSLDTEENRNLPRGVGSLRLIVVATFFVEPLEAL
ncbi:MAG: hypothetical protein A2341_14245 [Deltaproteobacteria bacterium RIFOXYB12_FULL_58_9]|nr:MAG: hypothetical protein A2341_14245 [Deltaproteobacteria bacterium RIFOXYB12_FULL_58_9]